MNPPCRSGIGAVTLAVLLGIACLSTAGSAAAQTLSVGVYGGLNRATLGGADAGAFDSRTAYAAGGFLTYRLSRALAVQPEVLYTHKGGEAPAVEGTGGVRLTYLEVPVLARIDLSTPGSRSLRPHLLAGPAVGFRIGCQVDADVEERLVRFDCDAPLFGGELATKAVEYGLVFGGGATLRVAGAVVGLDGRYTLGLSSIDDTAAADDVRNRVFAILAGISYPLRR